MINEFENRCCVCGGTCGLVWNMPNYPQQWVHLGCGLEAAQPNTELPKEVEPSSLSNPTVGGDLRVFQNARHAAIVALTQFLPEQDQAIAPEIVDWQLALRLGQIEHLSTPESAKQLLSDYLQLVEYCKQTETDES